MEHEVRSNFRPIREDFDNLIQLKKELREMAAIADKILAKWINEK